MLGGGDGYLPLTIRLGSSRAVRDVIEEQMENIFSGNKTPQRGLDDAVAKGNEILKEFAALHNK